MNITNKKMGLGWSSPVPSISDNSSPKTNTFKQLNQCSATDVAELIQREGGFDVSLQQKIKQNGIGGIFFTDLAGAIGKGDGEAIKNERNDLRKALVEMQIPVGVADAFLRTVIEKKIKSDIEHSRSFISAMNTTNTFASKMDANISESNPLRSDSDYQQMHLDVPYVPSIKFTELTEEETKAVSNFKKKLESFEAKLKKKGYTLHDYGYDNDIELEAQNNVCADRFLFNHFGKRQGKGTDIFVSIKLIVSSLGNEENRVSNTIKSQITQLFTEYGMTHTSLLIGHWRIEWFDNSIVSIRTEDIGSNAISVVDIATYKTQDKKKVESLFQTIASICCKYNGGMEYSRFTCNCQHFTTELLTALGLTTPLGEPFDRYFRDLKHGSTERRYYYTSELKKLLEYNKDQSIESWKPFHNMDTIVFNTRGELDNFCRWLDSFGYFSSESGSADFQLLKTFDRSFCISKDEQKQRGLVVVDYDNGGKEKECAFFSKTQTFHDNSIKMIVFKLGDIVIPAPNRM